MKLQVLEAELHQKMLRAGIPAGQAPLAAKVALREVCIYRERIVCTLKDHMSFRQIAAVLRMSVGAVHGVFKRCGGK